MLIGLFLLFAAQDLVGARSERLTNGLQIIVVEDRSQSIVSVQLWYRAGSALDSPQRTGTAQLARRFLEHRDGAALRLRAAGARFDSRTLRDACYFETVAPAGFLDFILDVESRRMRGVQPGEVEKSRPSVAPDISLCEEVAEHPQWAQADSQYHTGVTTPDDLTRRAGEALSDNAMPALLAAAFPDHPYQHQPDLISGELANLPPEDLRAFLGRWFVPGNAVLLIVGDLPALPTMEKARRLFGELPWAEPPRRHDYGRPARDEVRTSTAAGDRGVDFAWVTLPWGYFENAAVDGLMHALCNPVDGTLALRLREAGLGRPRFERFAWYEAGLLRLSVDAPANKLDETERIVRAALEEATTTVESVAQVNRAAAAMHRRLLERSAEFRGRALLLGLHQMVGGDLLLAAHEPLRIDRVSVGDMQRAAEMLADRRRVVLRRGEAAGAESGEIAGKIKPAPFEASTSLDANEALSLLSEFQAAPNISPVPPPGSSRQATATRPASADRSAVDVRVHARSHIPLATVRTTVELEPAGSFGAAASLLAGSRRHSADQLRGYLSYHAIEMRPCSDGRRLGLIADGPPWMIPQMVEWQAELLRLPPSDPGVFEAASEELAGQREQLLREPANLADYLALRMAGGMTAQLPPAPSPEQLRELRALASAASGVRVEISGPQLEAETQEVVRTIWSSLADAVATAETTRAAVVGSAAPADAGAVIWRAGARDHVEVRIITDTAGAASLPLNTIARLLGPPAPSLAAIDATRRWRWIARPVEPNTIIASAAFAPDDGIVERVTALVGRVRAIESGELPAGQLSLARRLAAVDALLGPLPTFSPAANAEETAAEGFRIRVLLVGGEPSLQAAVEAALHERR